MSNTVRHALRDYLATIDQPEAEYKDETYTQINLRAGEQLTAAVDALAHRMRLSRSAAAKFVLESAIYDALDEIGLVVGLVPAPPDSKRDFVWVAMTPQEQLLALGRGDEVQE